MGTVLIQPALGAFAAASFSAGMYAGANAHGALLGADPALYAAAASCPWAPISSEVHPAPFSDDLPGLCSAYTPESRRTDMLIEGPFARPLLFRSSPLNRREQLSLIEDTVAKRAEGFWLLHHALAIDTEDERTNLELKHLIAQELAMRGLFDAALRVDTGFAYQNVLLMVFTAEAMVKSGETDRAREVMNEALEVDVGRLSSNAELALEVGSAYARVGMFDEALETDTKDAWHNAKLRLVIADAMMCAGMPKRACEVLEAALAGEVDSPHMEGKLKIKLGMAYVQTEMTEQAREIWKETLTIDTGVPEWNAELAFEIGLAFIQAEMPHEAIRIDAKNIWKNVELKLALAETWLRLGNLDQARKAWSAALTIDMGSKGQDGRRRHEVGKAMAEAGFFDDALAIDALSWQDGLNMDISRAMARAGRFQEAIEIAIDKEPGWAVDELKADIGLELVKAKKHEDALKLNSGNPAGLLQIGTALAHARMFDEALKIDTGRISLNARLKLEIVQALMRAGEEEFAIQILETVLNNVRSKLLDAPLKVDMAIALAQAGRRRRAKEICEMVLRDEGPNPFFNHKVCEKLMQVGMPDIVRKVFEEVLENDTADCLTKHEKEKDGTIMAQAAGQAFEGTLIGAQDFLEFASTALAKELVRMGAAMSMQEIRLVAASLADGRRDFRRTQDLMIAGHLSVWRVHDVAGEDRAALIKRHAGLVQRALKKDRDLSSIYPSLLTLYHLQAAGESGALSVLLDAGRKLFKKRRADYPLLQILARCDSSKAKDFVMQGVSSNLLNERQAWLLLERLIEVGYLDEGLSAFFDARISKVGEDGEAQSKERTFLLRTVQYMHRELGLCPDVRLMEFVLDGAGDLDAVRSKIAEMGEHKAAFDAIEDRHELISKLAQDERAATIYFILYGGRTRYALVNNYDLGKFLTIVRKMHAQKIHTGPLAEFLEFFPQERREGLRDRLLAGRFPLDGAPGHAIRIDVSDSAQLDAVEGRAAQVFGSEELGAVIKAVMYRMSDELTAEEREALDGMGGIGDAPAIISAIEKEHPNLAEETAKALRKRWKKLMGKKVLEVGIDQIFGNETNEVALGRMVKGLEEARGTLKTRIRREFQKVRKTAQDALNASTREAFQKAREAARVLRDERLAALEEKARAKLMRYILQDMLVGEGDVKANQLFDEWENHLEQVLTNYEALKEGAGNRQKEKRVFVRFLDKRADLVELARIADSAQCCFNSKNYIIGNGMGAADWIGMLSSDPLSFAFQIEEFPASNPANAIGFVFGSFGVKNGKPAVFLNGVYMEGKTDAAARVILSHIEQQFSRPLGAASQVVASKHAGTSEMDEAYSNEPVEVKRLRAIAMPNSDEAITVIHDDLNVGINEPQKTDKDVWHKDFD